MKKVKLYKLFLGIKIINGKHYQLQNQILDGIVESKVNAMVMGKELDAGDVFNIFITILERGDQP